MLRVTDFQVEIVPVAVEDPVGLLRGQTGCVDSERTDHTFELLECLVLQGGLERTQQRQYLRVGLQYVENGLVVLVQERQDMRHVGVPAQPVGGLHDESVSIPDNAGKDLLPCLRIGDIFRNERLPVLVIGHLVPVAEKEDAGREEVHGRGLEELVRSATAFLLSLLKGVQQGLGGLAGRREVVDVLELDRIDALGVLDIHEVDDVEREVRGDLLPLEVEPVMVIELPGEGGELVVVHHHREALGAVLPDERLDDREGLT